MTKATRNLKQLPDGKRDVLGAVMLVLAAWDAGLFAHSEQVARELLRFAPAGCEEEWYWAGLLHDTLALAGTHTCASAYAHLPWRIRKCQGVLASARVGKIAIDPEILRKRGKLSRKQRRVMQQHPLKGAALLKQIGAPLTLVQSAQYHHERWDGMGYPYDIRGEQIPFVARVLAIADTYAALTSDRPYRRAFTPMQARLEIERKAGTQFDPEIVQRFFVEYSR